MLSCINPRFDMIKLKPTKHRASLDDSDGMSLSSKLVLRSFSINAQLSRCPPLFSGHLQLSKSLAFIRPLGRSKLNLEFPGVMCKF